MLWKSLSSAAFAVISIVVLAGCDSLRFGSNVDSRPDYISSLKFFENLVPKGKTVFTLDGVPTDYKLVSKRTDSQLFIMGTSGDEVLSEEVYSLTSDVLGLIKAGGEQFSPALPLLKFPLSAGDHYDWKGTVMAGSQQISAEAAVTTKTAMMAFEGKPLESIEVSVDLSIAGRGNHFLTFNLSRENGIFKTQIGKTLREMKP